MAEASFISFLSNIFSDEDTKQEVLLAETNSQNMSLLQSVPNSDPNAAKGGGDITIVGDEALLSETGPSGTVADIEEGSPDGIISTYIVQKGDSISTIAKMFNVSVNTIAWANDIKSGSYIKEGQTLIILPISGIKYTVKLGDSLKKIVEKYKGELEEVLQYNDLSADSPLAVGDTIIIPNGKIESVAASVKSSNPKVRGANSPSYAGYYIRPIEGGRKSQGIHGYNAVDLAAPTGTLIYASAPGKIIISKNYGWNGGYGQYVVMEHPNKTQTVYGHMSKNITYQGQYVERGQVIGYVGSTGRSTGPHVHFEIRGAKNPF
ncbi:MAG: peptidase family protein [Parcubacteria group bacterium]|nr:peptidase family protein [Parcubacteria group bacterium]